MAALDSVCDAIGPWHLHKMDDIRQLHMDMEQPNCVRDMDMYMNNVMDTHLVKMLVQCHWQQSLK